MTDQQVQLFLADLAIIILLARLLGTAAKRFGQPPVLGEIIAGILLGPTLFHGKITATLTRDGETKPRSEAADPADPPGPTTKTDKQRNVQLKAPPGTYTLMVEVEGVPHVKGDTRLELPRKGEGPQAVVVRAVYCSDRKPPPAAADPKTTPGRLEAVMQLKKVE